MARRPRPLIRRLVEFVLLRSLRYLLLAIGTLVTAAQAPAAATDLRAGVRLDTGTLYLWNVGTTPYNLTGYSLSSPTGDLLPANWLSVANNYDASSGGELDANDNWLVITQTSTSLSEGDFFGDGGLLPSLVPLSLGNVWNTAGTQQLTLTAAEGVSNSVLIDVAFLYAADFDGDGDVDRDDLVPWRAGFGTDTGASFLNGDADSDGAVDGIDYFIWLDQLGLTTIPPAVVAPVLMPHVVPEPTAGLLVGAAASIGAGCWRRFARKSR